MCERVLLYGRRAAYVGVNTWDLMDKSRDTSARPEILQRLDAMVKAGWSVGRTWGFSLGGGLSDGPLGKVIADPSKILETAPGEPAALCCLHCGTYSVDHVMLSSSTLLCCCEPCSTAAL